MAINYSSPGVPGGEVSPGAGSTGFTSRRVAYANSSGQLDNAVSTGETLVSRLVNDATSNHYGMTTVAGSTVAKWASEVSGGQYRVVEIGVGAAVQISTGTGGAITLGSSASGKKLNLPSTVNISTGVGAAGNAAALPATPEVYIRILAPNAAGTLSTLYLPAYTST